MSGVSRIEVDTLQATVIRGATANVHSLSAQEIAYRGQPLHDALSEGWEAAERDIATLNDHNAALASAVLDLRSSVSALGPVVLDLRSSVSAVLQSSSQSCTPTLAAVLAQSSDAGGMSIENAHRLKAVSVVASGGVTGVSLNATQNVAVGTDLAFGRHIKFGPETKGTISVFSGGMTPGQSLSALSFGKDGREGYHVSLNYVDAGAPSKTRFELTLNDGPSQLVVKRDEVSVTRNLIAERNLAVQGTISARGGLDLCGCNVSNLPSGTVETNIHYTLPGQDAPVARPFQTSYTRVGDLCFCNAVIPACPSVRVTIEAVGTLTAPDQVCVMAFGSDRAPSAVLRQGSARFEVSGAEDCAGGQDWCVSYVGRFAPF